MSVIDGITGGGTILYVGISPQKKKTPGGVPATEHYVEVLDPEGQVRRFREAKFFVTEDL